MLAEVDSKVLLAVTYVLREFDAEYHTIDVHSQLTQS